MNKAHGSAPSNAKVDGLPTLVARPLIGGMSASWTAGNEAKSADLHRALREYHLLLRSDRLYDKNHPRRLQSLEDAYESLRALAADLSGFDIEVQRNGLIVPKLGEGQLPDVKGEMAQLAGDLLRSGINALRFNRQFHVGELDTLANLLKDSLLVSVESSKRGKSAWWEARLLEHGVEGISVNTQTARKVDTVLASLIAALVAYGGSSSRDASESPITVPDSDDLIAALRLLARLTPPLETARGLSPEEAARSIHSAMEQASRDTVRMLLASMTQYGPREGERPQPYLLRLSQTLIFEFLSAEFSAGTLTPGTVRSTFQHLADVIVDAGGYSGPHSSQHLSSLATTWASDTHREQLVEKFWLDLAPRETSAVFRGPEVWCVPVIALRQNLGQLAEAGADAPRREARNVVLNFARRLDHPDAAARRSVAAGLNELTSIIESLWLNQLPEDLHRGAMKALEQESVPETAALLAELI